MIISSYLLFANQFYFDSGLFIKLKTVGIVEKAAEKETPLITPSFQFFKKLTKLYVMVSVTQTNCQVYSSLDHYSQNTCDFCTPDLKPNMLFVMLHRGTRLIAWLITIGRTCIHVLSVLTSCNTTSNTLSNSQHRTS